MMVFECDYWTGKHLWAWCRGDTLYLCIISSSLCSLVLIPIVIINFLFRTIAQLTKMRRPTKSWKRKHMNSKVTWPVVMSGWIRLIEIVRTCVQPDVNQDITLQERLVSDNDIMMGIPKKWCNRSPNGKVRIVTTWHTCLVTALCMTQSHLEAIQDKFAAEDLPQTDGIVSGMYTGLVFIAT